MEIEVIVQAEGLREGKHEKRVTNRGFFTFVSLDANGRVLPMKQIVPETEAEIERFDDGLKRYEERKAARRAASKK